MPRLVVQLTETLTDLASRAWLTPQQDVSGQTPLGADGDVAVAAMNKALNAVAYSEDDFLDDELRYLRNQGYLVEAAGGSYFAPSMRKQVGCKLFSWLFPGTAPNSLYLEQRRSQPTVDIELRFDSDAPLAVTLPWELIHDGMGFVVGGGRGTLMRRIGFDGYLPNGGPVVVDPLKVLIISPRPKGEVAALDDRELTAIERTDRITVERLVPATVSRLESYLEDLSANDAPHVIHFDGHGTYGRRCQDCSNVSGRRAPACTACNSPRLGPTEGFLAWEDDRGGLDWVSAQTLADQLGYAARQSELPLRLVVLSACSSAAAAGGESAFSGAAQSLIRAAVPAVVAMQFRIDAEAAVKFATRFYHKLAMGIPLAHAVAGARTALDMERDQWYRPVLYLRTADNDDGAFFQMPPPRSDDPRVRLIKAQTPAETSVVSVDGRRKVAGIADLVASVSTAVTVLALKARTREVDGVLRPFQADFAAISKQLDLLTDYKDLHDKLHELKLNVFAPIHDDLEASGDSHWTFYLNTSRYELQFRLVLDRLTEVVRRAHVPAAHVRWISQLGEAHQEMHQGVQRADSAQIRWALELLRPVLDTQPVSINTHMSYAAEALQLARLSCAFETVVAAPAGLQATERELLRQGIHALDEVQRMLGGLVEEHTDWQAIEIALLGAEPLLDGPTLDDFGWRWRGVRTRLEAAIGMAVDWNAPILEACDRVDKALVASELEAAAAAFDDCCRGVEIRFYNLDDQLKRFCGSLSAVATGVGMLARGFDLLGDVAV